jgi:hypothetical protein
MRGWGSTERWDACGGAWRLRGLQAIGCVAVVEHMRSAVRGSNGYDYRVSRLVSMRCRSGFRCLLIVARQAEASK